MNEMIPILAIFILGVVILVIFFTLLGEYLRLKRGDDMEIYREQYEKDIMDEYKNDPKDSYFARKGRRKRIIAFEIIYANKQERRHTHIPTFINIKITLGRLEIVVTLAVTWIGYWMCVGIENIFFYVYYLFKKLRVVMSKLVYHARNRYEDMKLERSIIRKGDNNEE